MIAFDDVAGIDPRSLRGDTIALAGTTSRLFDECLLANGALIEAPGGQPFYPDDARDPFRVFPGRDIPITLAAMQTMGRDLREPLTRWLAQRVIATPWPVVLATSYHVHGPVTDARPDGEGTALLQRTLTMRQGHERLPSTSIVAGALLASRDATPASLIAKSLANRIARTPSALATRLWSGQLPDDELRVLVERLVEDWKGNEAAPLTSSPTLLFSLSVAADRIGELDIASAAYVAGLAHSDHDGHFPEGVDAASPRPWLHAHMAFLLAADRVGGLRALPKSGYTRRA